MIKVNEDFDQLLMMLTKSESFRNGFVMIDKKTGKLFYQLYNRKEDGEYEGTEELLTFQKMNPTRYLRIDCEELVDGNLWEREKVEAILKLMKKYDIQPKDGLKGCEHQFSVLPQCPKCGYSKHFADCYCAKCGTELEEREETIDIEKMWNGLD